MDIKDYIFCGRINCSISILIDIELVENTEPVCKVSKLPGNAQIILSIYFIETCKLHLFRISS